MISKSRVRIELIPGIAVRSASKKIIGNLACGRFSNHDTPTLMNWLLEAAQNSSTSCYEILSWVIESSHHRQVNPSKPVNVKRLLECGNLTHRLSEVLSCGVKPAIPESARLSFPVLNRTIIQIPEGDAQFAKKWIQKWVARRTKKILKICDPFFRADGLNFVGGLREDCTIMICTTDKYLDAGKGNEALKSEFLQVWERLCSGALPQIILLVAPAGFKDQFTQVAIAADDDVLSINRSLKDLGKSPGTITMLSEDDSKEFCSGYLKNMFSWETWLHNHTHEIKVLQLSCR